MASEKQRSAARKNIKKAVRAAKRKKTLKVFTEKNTASARATSRESQRVTPLNVVVTNRGKVARILVTPEIAMF